MRIVFMGSGSIACPTVEMLLFRADVELVAVVTQPDRPRGRHLQLAACPVKSMVETRGVPVLTPEKASDPAFIDSIAALKPDLVVVAAYGQILRQALLDVPLLGCINLHPSLLPTYRGAAPIQWTLANGDTETGVTIMYMSARMDAGDIILQEKMPVQDEDTAASLEIRLAALGADLLSRTIDQLAAGEPLSRVPQDESRVTLAPKLKKEDGLVDWNFPAAVIRHRVRGFQTWPCCQCEFPAGSGQRVKLLRVHAESAAGEPGVVLGVDRTGPLVATGEGSLRLLEVQPEGRKAMPGQAFANGARLKPGDRFG